MVGVINISGAQTSGCGRGWIPEIDVYKKLADGLTQTQTALRRVDNEDLEAKMQKSMDIAKNGSGTSILYTQKEAYVVIYGAHEAVVNKYYGSQYLGTIMDVYG